MEEHFKNKLKNHKVDWDKEDLLGNMQKELSQNQSRFNRKWLWLLPLVFIGTCLGLSDNDFFYGNIKQLNNAKKPDVNNGEIKNNESVVHDLNQTENQILANKSIVNNSDSNHVKKTNLISLSSNEVLKSEQLNKSNPIFKLNNKEAIKGSDKSNSILKSGFLKNNILTDNAAKEINNDNVLNKKHALPNENKISIITNRKISKPIARIPFLKIPKFPFDEALRLNLPVAKMDTEEPKKIKKMVDVKNYFFANSSVEAGLIYRNMNFQTNNPEPNEESKFNEKTIKSRALLSTNIALGYQHQSGWSLQSGLEYNRIVEFFKMDDTLGFEEIKLLDDKALYFLDANADTLFFSDSATVINSNIRKVRHNNHHSYFNIPVEVGYRRSIGKVNLFGTVGMSYAFAHNFKGREARLFETGIIEVLDNPTYSLKNKFGYKISCGVEYPLFQRTHIFMNMAYRRSPKLISREVREQFYQSYSVGLGIRVLIK